MKKHVSIPLAGLLGLVLAGCSSPEATHPDALPQQWNGWDVRVETRPSPPLDGMNEFLVIMTGSHHPVTSCLVDLRTSQMDEWKQAIQDGLVGVYRRAALLEPGERRTLQVRLHCGEEKELNTILFFPILVKPA